MSMKRKITGLILVLVMALAAIPMNAVMAAEKTDSSNNVVIYTTVDNLEIKDASGKKVEAEYKEAASENDYNTYTIPATKGTYNYSADGYGTGVLKVTEGSEVYMREVQYKLHEAGACAFKMRIVNTTDEDLVYESEASVENQTANLLVPAYDYNIRYEANFEPMEDKYCPFYCNLWVEKGTTVFEGFKQNAYNLSDSGKYTMEEKRQVTISVPTGAKLSVVKQVKFYRQLNEYRTTLVRSEDGLDTYTAVVPTNSGNLGGFFVTKEGCDMYGSALGSKTEYTVKDLDNMSVTSVNEMERSIITGGNTSKFISLEKGESFGIWSSRAWQAISSVTGNSHTEPVKHYHVLEGDSVTVDEYGVVRAVKDGMTVVAITYDAMNLDGTKYEAIREDCVAVFVFMVGGSKEGLTTGVENTSDTTTTYYNKTLTIDGVEKVEKNSKTTVTIYPKAEDGSAITVSTANVSGYPKPKMTKWETYEANEDGSYTINLYSGRNIVKVQAGDKIKCHVLHAVGCDVTVENLTNPDTTIKAGDQVKVFYKNVLTPVPKLAAIYNPGYPDTEYLIGTLSSDAENGKDADLKGEAKQYYLPEVSGFTFTVSNAGTFTVKDVSISTASFGASDGGHLALSLQSGGGTYKDGDLSPEHKGLYCTFQNVSFQVADSEHTLAANKIIALIDDIGTVEDTEACREKIEKARAAYNCAEQVVQDMIAAGKLKVLTDAETAYQVFLDAKVKDSIETKTIDEKSYYVIKDADELIWFSRLVSGSLKGVTQNQNANAILEADIDVSGKAWIPIGGAETYPIPGNIFYKTTVKYGGTFDGNGHTVSGVYVNATAQYQGVFGYINGATVKDLTVKKSSIRTTKDYAGGIVGHDDGKNNVIESVSYEGNVLSGGRFVGGIIGWAPKTSIIDCTFKGKLEGKERVGGISGYSGKIESCYTGGTVTAENSEAGGIVGRVASTTALKNCYSHCKVSAGKSYAGGISGASDSVTIENCYAIGTVTTEGDNNATAYAIANRDAVVKGAAVYLDTMSDAVAAKKMIALTEEQFKAGQAACLLGNGFGQKIGVDTYPVFNDGTNQVFCADGKYVNASTSVFETLVGDIGTVAVYGKKNCFINTVRARECYDILTAEEQQAVQSSYWTLLTKENNYTAAVATIIAQIDAIGEASSSGDKIAAARADYDAYIERGGDESKITNYDTLVAAEKASDVNTLAKEEAAIEKTMTKTTIDGEEFYEISNTEQLYWFAKLVNGTLQRSTVADPEANAILTADITLNKNVLATIADKDYKVDKYKLDDFTIWTQIENFDGIFDGNGHVISGVVYVQSTNYTASMFKTVTGTLKNLVVKDSYMKVYFPGGLVGTLDGGTMDSCGFEGLVEGDRSAGGLVHLLSNGGKISNCYSLAVTRITETMSDSLAYQFRNGGIVSYVSEGTIENCYAAGTLIGGYHVGGIVGNFVNAEDLTIKNCYYKESEGLGLVSSASSAFSADENSGSFTAKEMADGTLARKLGVPFGQRVGIDPYPVFQSAVSQSMVEEVEDKIDAIGEVTADSEKAISKARESYDALDEELQALVTNYETLEAAEATLAAKKVEAKIAALGDITVESESAITEVQEAYRALTEKQKAQVTNYETLKNAVNQLKTAKEVKELEAKVEEAKKEAEKSNTAEAQKKVEELQKVLAFTTKQSVKVTIKMQTTKKIVVNWTAVEGAEKYLIKIQKNGKTVKTVNTEKNTYTCNVGKEGYAYTVMVTPTLTYEGNVYKGVENENTVIVKPSTPAVSVKKNGSKVKVTAKKRVCTGYQIQVSKKSTFSSKKNYRVKGTALSKSIKVSSLKKGKNYIRVRAYTTYNGKTVYSKWSKTKTVKK